MKLDNVYIGFTKDGKERLLYKKYGVIVTNVGDVNYTEFVDLNNKEVIDSKDIDINSLKPISMLLSKQRLSKRKVIKIYNMDRNKFVDCSNLFYANRYFGWLTYLDHKENLIEKECLVYWGIEGAVSKIQSFEKIDSCDDTILKREHFKYLKPASDYFIDKNSNDYEIENKNLISKKLILELDYKRKKEME